MSTNVPVIFQAFLHCFVLAKLATTSMRVKFADKRGGSVLRGRYGNEGITAAFLLSCD